METQENITLNGFPARIAGWKNDFATIHELHPGTISAEFSWLTVEHIIDTKGGAFRA